MAVIIIEGQDNCGKSTLINQLMKMNPNPKRLMIHSSTPPTEVDALEWSKSHYNNVLEEALSLSDTGWDVYFDRAHLGEYVYGPIYRQTPGDWIFDTEVRCGYDGEEENIFLIVLTGTNEHLNKNDDGKSISTDCFDAERAAFYEAFTKSTIQTKLYRNLDNSFNGLLNDAQLLIRREL